MIAIRETGDVIINPGAIKRMSVSERENLRVLESLNQLDFIIPDRFTDNTEKSIYKVGFLAEFLKELYPMDNFMDTCSIMTQRYHIFLGKRQIERHTKSFLRNEKYLNGSQWGE